MEKLVRDKIPDVIASKGGKAAYHFATGEELREKTTEKILEEKNELLSETVNENGNKELEEVADLMEVVIFASNTNHPSAYLFEKDFMDLIGEKNIQLKDIERIRAKKREEFGGFDEGVILETS